MIETYTKIGTRIYTGNNELKKYMVQQILWCQISGLQVKSSAINQDHYFKKWNLFGWKKNIHC